jgi:hypothetical protein
VARAHRLARVLEGVAEVVEKYRLLEALRRGEPGRTVARRDAMRAIAARFPAALREWDEAPLEEIARRRAEAEATLADLVARGEAALPRLSGGDRDWLRYSMSVHARLRALRVKRWIAGRKLTPSLAEDARRALDVDRAELEAIASPPGRRVSEGVYRQVAAEHGVTVDQLKAALFPHHRGQAPPGLRPGTQHS